MQATADLAAVAWVVVGSAATLAMVAALSYWAWQEPPATTTQDAPDHLRRSDRTSDEPSGNMN